MLRDEEIRIDIGRAEGGDFIKIIHIPTGISRIKMPPIGSSRNQYEIKKQFLNEIENEIKNKGLTQYIIKNYL
jgi:hypothetical protein